MALLCRPVVLVPAGCEVALTPTIAPTMRLPSALTSFVGRQRELAAIGELLRRARLLTLTGSGGTGKTRLALESAARAGDEFPDGILFVDLSAVRNPALVLPAIAAALEVREEPKRPLQEQVVAALAGRRLLLVLDNFEQVLPAAAPVGELLSVCPDLKMMVTSREPLHLLGEQEYAVGPLGLPEEGRAGSPERLAQSEAVQLFVERARLIRADFALTAGNAPAVADICRRLDGLPLALELAAAHARLYSPEALLARLELGAPRVLPLLTGGARNLPARQQTLRDTIAWSYDLLDGREQALFRRLAVFPAGFTLDAAEVVACDDGELGRWGDGATGRALDIPTGIESLVARSLLRQREPAGGELRFGMLETIREYGLEQLRAQGELDMLRERHRRYVLALAERALREHVAVTDTGWWDRLLAEHAGLHAALRWSIERGDADEALRLAAAVHLFCRSGHLAEGRQLLAQALALPAAEDEGGRAVRGRALRSAGKLAWTQGDVAASHRYFEESLALYRDLADADGLADALRWAACATGDSVRARMLLDESLRLALEAGSARGHAMTLISMGEHRRLEGDYAAARTLYAEGLRLLEQAGEATETPTLLTNLGYTTLRLGDPAEAERLFRDALARCGQGDWGTLTALCLAGLGGVAAARGLHARAARLLAAGQVLMEGQDAAFGGADRPEVDRDLAAVRIALDERAFAVAWASGQALTPEEALALALAAEAVTPGATGAPQQAAAGTASAGGLTPRERDVALLVAQGFTNRRIAERLVISERTADAHVANILGKLGFSNRAQIASWVAGREHRTAR